MLTSSPSPPPGGPGHGPRAPVPWYRAPVVFAAAVVLVSVVGGTVAGRISAEQHGASPELLERTFDVADLTAEQRRALRGPAGPRGARGVPGAPGPAGNAAASDTLGVFWQQGENTTLIDENAAPVVSVDEIPDGIYLVLASARVTGAPQNRFAASCSVKERSGERSQDVMSFDSVGAGVTDSAHAIEIVAATSVLTMTCVRRSQQPVEISNPQLTVVRVHAQPDGS